MVITLHMANTIKTKAVINICEAARNIGDGKLKIYISFVEFGKPIGS